MQAWFIVLMCWTIERETKKNTDKAEYSQSQSAAFVL